MHLADLERAHWDSVRAIYEEGLATGHASFETAAPPWDAWDSSHLAAPRLVAIDDDGSIAGWTALSPVSRRAVYTGVAEVSVYVRGSARGRGVGHLLLDELIRRSEAIGIWMLSAGIFPENVASCRLHVAHGFRLVGRRERIGRHHGVWRDTLLFERRSKSVGAS